MTQETSSTPIPEPVQRDHPKWRRVRRVVIWIAAALMVLGPLTLAIAGLGAKVGLWDWGFGLGTLTRQVAPLIMFGAIIAGLVALLLSLLVKPRSRTGIIVAVLAGVIPLIGFARMTATQAKVARLPYIHDISTDTQDPPVFGAVIQAERAAMEGVNTLDYAGKTAPTAEKDADGKPVMKLVSALQTQAYPEVRTLVLTESPDVVFGQATAIARSMGWAIKESDKDAGRIDATATTFWYGFEDDVTIRLRPGAGGGTRLDIRSVSRVGMSDIGANAERIEAFLDAMRER